MSQEEIKLSYGEGRYSIYLSAIITADGVSATVTGGDRPHVGGMALSIPRLGPGEVNPGCNTWITPRPGHKDSEVAAMVSRLICLETGQAAACIAGIHIDQAQRHEIDLLLSNSREAAMLLVNEIREIIETDA